MNKKVLAMLLSSAMVLGAAAPAAAAQTGTDNPLAGWTDIASGDWFYDPVQYAIEAGIMGSISTDAKQFDPNGTVTRAMVYQTLYSLAGKPAVTDAATFPDVAGTWYADSAAWAQDAGLAAGDSDGSYAGDRTATRAELSVMLSAFAAYQGLHTETADLSGYADFAQVPAWAKAALETAVGSGLMSGKPGNLLDPNGSATRAELATMLYQFSQLKKYDYDPEHPYDGVMSGIFHNIEIAVGEDKGIATYYLPEGLQPWTPAVIVLTPDNTTAEAFSNSETGKAWQAVADKNKIGLAFLEPQDGKSWNLTLDENGRDDAAILNQLYMTMRSKALTNVAPFSMDKSHTTVVGYEEGGAAALLFGGRYATDFSGICAVDAPAVSAEAFAQVGKELVLPFPGDSTLGIQEMNIQAKTVDTPVWFVNSAEENQPALDYYIAANEAKAADANEYAEKCYQAADSDARIWVSSESQSPDTIYSAFLGTTKRFMAMQEGGRVSFAEDFTRKGYTIHEEQINGEPRRWITYVPSTYTGEEDVPLVVVMHGYTASMYAIAEESRWYDVAEENGFIVLFMQAMVRPADAMGNIPASIWCAGSFASALPDVDPQVDVNFINTVLDKTEAQYKIDESRVYATGHSNGSMMSWTLGVESTERFAAIAPIGYMTTPTSEFSSEALLPTWAMAGEYDTAATVEMVEGNATVTALQAWNEHNGLDESDRTNSTQYDGQWKTTTFSNEDGVPLVKFTNVLGTPHVYMQEQSVTIWEDFFSKYSRGEDGTLYYEGKAVESGEYKASSDWYSPAES